MPRLAHLLKKSVAGVTVAASLATVGTVVAVGSAIAASNMTATGNVNLRTGPGTSYGIITYIPTGATVSATGVTSGSWLQVTYNGKTGYAYSTYLKAASTTAPVTTTAPATSTTGSTATTTANVNVRSGPGTSYGIVGYAPRGTQVKLTGSTSGAWTQVVWSGVNRWIYSSYLSTTTATALVSTPAPTTSSSAVVGQVRATTNVNMRTTGYSTGSIYGVLPANTVVDVTGQKTASYTQISYAGRLLWIYTAYTAPVSSSPSAPATTSDERLQKVLDYARAQVGDRYVWGAEGPDAFDCSGLTMMAYRQAGISLPHYSGYQAKMGTAVSASDMKPGDLIFWYSPVAHVSIYIGNGQMIHARGTAYGVVVQSVAQYSSWTPIVAVRRFIS